MRAYGEKDIRDCLDGQCRDFGTSSPPLSEVGREGFLGKIARVARASMARGPILFWVLVV